MHTIHRLSIFIAVVAATFLISGQVSPTLAGDQGGLGRKIAGTYLAVQGGEGPQAQALQISEDGNLSIIISVQFSSGVGEVLFSNTLGSWKKTGRREITARVVNLNFDSMMDGMFAGVATATYLIKFDKKFQAASVTCEGALFSPLVNPIRDPGSQSVPFTCGDLEFDRVAVDDDAEEDDGDDDKDKDKDHD